MSPTSTFIMFCITYAFLWISLCFDHNPPLQGIGIGNPSIDVIPVRINGDIERSKDVISCRRVPVFGVSRYQLQYYASVYNVTLTPSKSFPKKWHNRIQVCFHGNSSLRLCECETDDWRFLKNGIWSSTMSPYEQKYIDVKYDDQVTGSVNVTHEEVQQRWRYALLAVGVLLLFFAPVVSEWVPFYYASCMTIGVLAVVLILLYQVRKLLPTGRRKTFYLSIVVSALGAGSFVLHWLSTYINSILLNFGISPEIQNLVYCFAGLGILLLGASVGYWLLRRYIISKDGEVYDGVARFVKWSMRIVAVTCILLSTNDTPLAMVAVGSSLALYHVIGKMKWLNHQARLYSGKRNLWASSKQTTLKLGHTEFLTRPKKTRPLGSRWINPVKWANSPVKGMSSPLTNTGRDDVYSTFHKIPNRKKFSEEEWEDFTEESTRQSVAELASSPEFTYWLIKNADRIKLGSEDEDNSDDNGSETDSTDEYVQHSGSWVGYFSW